MRKLIYISKLHKAVLSKDDLNIKEITLLSIEEAEKLPIEICEAIRWWWLRSPGINSNYAAAVNRLGSINRDGFIVYNIFGAIRPALKIENLKSSNLGYLRPYNVVNYLGNLWYVISEDTLLSMNVIAIAAFNKDIKNQDANKFEGSSIQKWLLNWLSEKLK